MHHRIAAVPRSGVEYGFGATQIRPADLGVRAWVEDIDGGGVDDCVTTLQCTLDGIPVCDIADHLINGSVQPHGRNAGGVPVRCPDQQPDVMST